MLVVGCMCAVMSAVMSGVMSAVMVVVMMLVLTHCRTRIIARGVRATTSGWR